MDDNEAEVDVAKWTARVGCDDQVTGRGALQARMLFAFFLFHLQQPGTSGCLSPLNSAHRSDSFRAAQPCAQGSPDAGTQTWGHIVHVSPRQTELQRMAQRRRTVVGAGTCRWLIQHHISKPTALARGSSCKWDGSAQVDVGQSAGVEHPLCALATHRGGVTRAQC